MNNKELKQNSPKNVEMGPIGNNGEQYFTVEGRRKPHPVYPSQRTVSDNSVPFWKSRIVIGKIKGIGRRPHSDYLDTKVLHF